MFLAWHFIGYGRCSEAQGVGRFLSPTESQRIRRLTSICAFEDPHCVFDQLPVNEI